MDKALKPLARKGPSQVATSTFVSRGRRGTYGTVLALVARLGAGGCAVAPRGTWLALVAHLGPLGRAVTTRHFLRGRRGTWRHRPSFRMAGVALGDIGLRFAGLALGDIDLRFAWQAWRVWYWAGSGGALGAPWSRGDAAALCVAGVALGDIYHRFAWQVWHLATSTVVLPGRRGAWRHRPSFRVPGVALGDMDIPFAWQAWHLATSTFISRGRLGTYAALCVAGVADMDIPFAWQPWHLATWTWHLHGKRGAWSPLVARVAAALCMAGVW